jgi:AraC-like DNA-binding protein
VPRIPSGVVVIAMSSWADALEIDARTFPGILLERYRYGAGPPSDYPPHVHETYQIGIALDRGGEYHFRGATSVVPTLGLIVVHPGESHSVRDREERRAPTRYLMLYADVELVQAAGAEAIGRRIAAPFFGAPAFDADLVRTFLALYDGDEDDGLARESRLLMLFATLTARHADEQRRPPALSDARAGVRRARDYLHEHLASAVTLSALADVAGLSRYHLVRAFARAFGAPPHAYQLQLRIDAARRLLASGMSAAHVALVTGFFDQSHFGRHFRRIAGVSPGRYLPMEPDPPR